MRFARDSWHSLLRSCQVQRVDECKRHRRESLFSNLGGWEKLFWRVLFWTVSAERNPGISFDFVVENRTVEMMTCGSRGRFSCTLRVQTASARPWRFFWRSEAAAMMRSSTSNSTRCSLLHSREQVPFRVRIGFVTVPDSAWLAWTDVYSPHRIARKNRCGAPSSGSVKVLDSRLPES